MTLDEYRAERRDALRKALADDATCDEFISSLNGVCSYIYNAVSIHEPLDVEHCRTLKHRHNTLLGILSRIFD